MLKRLLAAALLLCCLSVSCVAAELDTLVEEGTARFGADALMDEVPESARKLGDELGLEGLSLGEIVRMSPAEIYHAVKISAISAMENVRGSLFAIIGTVLLCAALGCIGSGEGETAVVFETVAVLAVTAALSAPVLRCVEDAADSIVDASMFLLSYVPVYSTVITAGGQPMSAAGYSLSVMAAAQLTGQLAARMMVPLCGVYLALCLSGGICRNAGVLQLAAATKKFVNWSLTLAMTLFVGVLTLQSFMSSAADGATVKTTKFLVGSFVPVVGGTISDALSAAQSSIRLIKATIGSFGIAVAAMTFLPTLMQVTVLRMVVAIAAAAGETLGASQVKGILGGFGSVLAVLTGMLMSMALLMIISTAIMLAVGGGG